ncbi:MAG: hypothetical protein KDK36_19980, partial [Leptospiraceae bacterium]|nr:hypothetical protein [Leptospiraceae bacterium]
MTSAIKSVPIGVWILLLTFIYAILRAVHFRWVCDDSFISFRYARNFVRGYGLVFNVGEDVEGYTNFLWTIGIAFGMKLGIDPLRWVQGIGILSYAISILVVYIFGLKIFREYIQFINPDSAFSKTNSRNIPFSFLEKKYFPLAAIALCLQTHAQIFATGGLETSFFGMLIVSGYALIVYSKKLRNVTIGQFLLVLSAMTRPEGVLFVAFGLLYVILFHRRNFSEFQGKVRIFFSFLPFFLIYIPYWFWRVFYYSSFFPNTYYAKYGHGNFIHQGIK